MSIGIPPTFQRGPRQLLAQLGLNVDIPAPPPPPRAPEGPSLSNLLVPLGVTSAGMGVIYAATSASHDFQPLYLLATVPMLLASSGVSLWNSLVEGRAYRRKAAERSVSYRETLAELDQTLERQVAEQCLALAERDPDPAECLRRARTRAASLWERSPGDPDFLRVRLGLGPQPAPLGLRFAAPSALADREPDPLVAAGRELATRFATLPDVPVCLPLPEARIAGVQGPRAAAVSLARAMALQIATHHAPGEVKLVGLFPSAELAEWEWLRWLPHVWSDDRKQRYLATSRPGASQLLSALEGLLRRRAASRDDQRETASPAFVFLVADTSLVEGLPLLPLLLSPDPIPGVAAVFVADTLPNRCQVVLDVRQAPAQLLAKTGASATTSFRTDQADGALGDAFARSLAPLRVTEIAPSPAALPDAVPLLPLLGASRVEDLDVAARWRTSDPSRSLAVSIGRLAGNARLALDVHELMHGPHGLVAGQTRWGKTAFLRSFIASLAVSFHPHEVAFVLIDYKGGSLYRDLDALPHVVGVIDNLQEHLARRALLALKGELRRRQALFKQLGVGTFPDYQARQRAGTAPAPLPHLFVICDEFKELMVNQPDFAQEFISTASIGGGLGVHLILATQQPDGVVSDQIWSNTRFRVCFHFDKPDSSSAVLRRRDASTITTRGRGYLQVGDDEIFELFQSGFGDLAYEPDDRDERPEVFRVELDGRRVAVEPAPGRRRPDVPEAGTTQVQAVVRRVREVADQNGIAALPRFWHPPLPEQLGLPDLPAGAGAWDGRTSPPGGAWLAPVVGVLDDPARQWQGPFQLDFARNGNLGVYGGPQSGKSTFLQTLVVSLARAHAPADVVFYLLDFGGQALTALARLPHVGGVVTADESDRLSWTFRYLQGKLDRRKRLFAEAGVTSFSAYRQVRAEPLPAIFLGLDNYAGFAAAYPDDEDLLARLAQEGPGFGIYVGVTATTPRIRQKLKDSLPQAITFGLVDRADYADAVGRTFGLEPADLPGRGLVKANPPLEFQAALPTGGDEVERAAELRRLVGELDRSWQGVRPRPVPRVPEVVSLSELLRADAADGARRPEGARAVPLGLDLQSLDPLVVDLREGPHFLVAGPEGSGKTSLLRAWLHALAERHSADQVNLFLVDLRQAGLRPLVGLAPVQRVRGYVSSPERFAEVLASLEEEIGARARALQEARAAQADDRVFDERAFLAGYPSLVLAVDDFDAVSAALDDDAKYRLDELLNQGRELGLHLILAGASGDLNPVMHEPILRAARRSPAGFILGTSEYDDLQLLNLRLPGPGYGPSLAVGEGYFGRRGKATRVKVARPDEPPVAARRE